MLCYSRPHQLTHLGTHRARKTPGWEGIFMRTVKRAPPLESNQPGTEPWLCIIHCVTLGKTLHLSVPWFLICKIGILISFFLKRVFLGLNMKNIVFGFCWSRSHMTPQQLGSHQCKLWPFNTTDVMDMSHFCKITTKCMRVWRYHTFVGILWTLWWLCPFSILLASLNLSHVCSFSLCQNGDSSFSFLFFPQQHWVFVAVHRAPEHAGSAVAANEFICPIAYGILVPQPGIKPTDS